jgi:aminoglycoside 6'-N-acetyltransferase
MAALRLRPAAVEDIPMLRRWDLEPHVISSDPNSDWDYEDEIGRDLPGRAHLIAEADGEPVGFIEVTDPKSDESRYWGEMGGGCRALDIWIGPAERLGQGLGTQMMRQAIAMCFAEPDVHTILIDPLADNVRAHRFYERLGFRFVEERQFGDDECFVYRLDRADWRDGD